jgi:ABC-type transport system involved in cytochrome c biogenesis permease subunit
MKRYLPWFVLIGCVLYLLSGLKTSKSEPSSSIEEFGRLPVLVGGRIKPLDTVARNSLMIIHGKQTLRTKERKIPASEWLANVLMQPEVTKDQEVFVIHNSDILGMWGLEKTQKKYFSYRELEPHIEEIERQAKLADAVESSIRSAFQKEILKLNNGLELYERLKRSLRVDDDTDLPREIQVFSSLLQVPLDGSLKNSNPHAHSAEEMLPKFKIRYEFLARVAYVMPIPPGKGQPADGWKSMGQSLLEGFQQKPIDPMVSRYATAISAYRAKDFSEFSRNVLEIRNAIQAQVPDTAFRARYEFLFNQFAPFYKCMALYVLVFLMVCFAWLYNSPVLKKSACWVLVLALLIHTVGLISRMYLQGRPPVTNLYSSAVFIGWAVVVLGLVLEKIFKDGVGSIVSSVLGFLTLLVAHHLSGDGDTLEMLRAVLDTNFWLATHVVTITIGYSATFLAGFLAILYIGRGTLTRSLDKQSARSLNGMVYGIVCFATLFSFVGTILGGIWADQSWGRFWGWDPKENGALLIVLWNAIVLHARWGGMIKERGLMVLAVFGNVITSFSWFGVNMLGVGLHSYGFMDKAFFWLMAFVVSQVLLMGVGILPLRFWRSRHQLEG